MTESIINTPWAEGHPDLHPIWAGEVVALARGVSPHEAFAAIASGNASEIRSMSERVNHPSWWVYIYDMALTGADPFKAGLSRRELAILGCWCLRLPSVWHHLDRHSRRLVCRVWRYLGGRLPAKKIKTCAAWWRRKRNWLSLDPLPHLGERWADAIYAAVDTLARYVIDSTLPTSPHSWENTENVVEGPWLHALDCVRALHGERAAAATAKEMVATMAAAANPA